MAVEAVVAEVVAVVVVDVEAEAVAVEAEAVAVVDTQDAAEALVKLVV